MAFDFGNIKSLFHFGGDSKIKQVIGVDIGSSAIKVVGLHEEDGVPTLDTYGELQLGPYAKTSVGKIVHLPEETMKEALVDIMRESSLQGTEAAFSVSNRLSLMTTLTIDSILEQEVESRIPVEARKYVPIPINEVTLDWFVLHTDKEQKKTKVLMAAIFNEAFQEAERVLAGAGLTMLVSELEPFGAVRATIKSGDANVILLDFGASATKLYVVQNGMVQDVHMFRLSGAEITNIFKESAQIDWDTAEELKRSIGIQKDGTYDAVVGQVRARLERELREIGNRIASEETEGGKPITKVYLLGGGVYMPGFVSLAEDVLGRPLELTNPFSKVAYPAFLEDTLGSAGPSFCVALGAALRGLRAE